MCSASPWLDVFGSIAADRPAFVFSGGASTKTIAEAVSHEAGHTLGLSHDATFASLRLLRRARVVGADHGSQHLVEARHAVVEG